MKSLRPESIRGTTREAQGKSCTALAPVKRKGAQFHVGTVGRCRRKGTEGTGMNVAEKKGEWLGA